MQVRPKNYTLRLRHGQKHENCIYWIVCNTGVFEKVNLALLTYQNTEAVGSVNCTTYF